MFTFVLVVHILACILLCVVILMQTGRGGGLTEAFASAESMFGASTNEMMIRLTTILGTVFLCTSLGLAFLSAKQERSLIDTRQQQEQDIDKKLDELFKNLETKEVIEIDASGSDEPEVPGIPEVPTK